MPQHKFSRGNRTQLLSDALSVSSFTEKVCNPVRARRSFPLRASLTLLLLLLSIHFHLLSSGLVEGKSPPIACVQMAQSGRTGVRALFLFTSFPLPTFQQLLFFQEKITAGRHTQPYREEKDGDRKAQRAEED